MVSYKFGFRSKQIGKKLNYASTYFCGPTYLCLISKCMQNNMIKLVLFPCLQWSLSTVSGFTFLLACLENKWISRVTKQRQIK